MKKDKCTNLNHSRVNVSIRHCSACGEVVNQSIQSQRCDGTIHAKRRKERDKFCIDCGKGLT